MKRKLFSPIVLLALLAGCTRPPAQEPNIQNNPATSTSPSVSVELPSQQPTEQTTPSSNFLFNSDSSLSRVTGNFLFTEGPAVDASGNVFFSDINAGKVYKWSVDGNVTVFREGLNMPNGLAFDTGGDLIACEGGSGRLISIDSQGQITVLADQYNGIRFNEPNDLWIDSQGGIYFTDPAYQSSVVQDGEHVYYLSPDRNQVIRVVEDMVKPNGIVGTADGKSLYITDNGAGQTFVYGKYRGRNPEETTLHLKSVYQV